MTQDMWLVLMDPLECTGPGQSARQEGSQCGRKPAQMNRELPSQLKNMEMEGQCQSSDAAGKAEIKGQKGFCKYIVSKGKAGKDMAPLLSLTGKAAKKDMDKAHVLSDWFALHLFLLFIFGFWRAEGYFGVFGGKRV